MRTIRVILFLLAAMFLNACGGGGGGNGGEPAPPPKPAGTVGIKCVAMYNTGEERDCITNVAPAATFRVALTTLNFGDISRGTEAIVSMTVINTTPDVFHGQFSAVTDLDCAGRTEPWEMAAGTVTLNAGQTATFMASRQCGDASLGSHSITLILYNVDRTVIKDQVQGQFTTVE